PIGAGLDPESECAKPDSGAGACEQVCDGKGACVSCGLFKCASTGAKCANTCAGDGDCKANAWCNGSTCELKKPNGATCTVQTECASNVCALGYCCNVACSQPSSCSTGQCLCNGVACTGSAKCITWYADGDGDTFGDPATHKLACDNAQPAGYVKD